MMCEFVCDRYCICAYTYISALRSIDHAGIARHPDQPARSTALFLKNRHRRYSRRFRVSSAGGENSVMTTVSHVYASYVLRVFVKALISATNPC